MAIINGKADNDTLNGTPDADTINGLAGNDTINGLAGNDTITGGEGNDLARMGAGNDRFLWQTGDGDDRLRGQDGFDTLVIEDSANVFFLIERNASRVRVAETLLGLFGNQLDLDDVERIIVRPLAGPDGVFINNLAGTDVKQVVVDLAGVPGGTGGDGEVDGVVRNGGAGNDVINVALASGIVSITGPSAQVTIRNADATDILEINGLGGSDTIDASKLPTSVIALSVNGDEGNDRITGSRGNDELDGDDGNDVIAGGRGNDLVDLGTGNDLFTWAIGDGKDTVQGGDGTDTLQITQSPGDSFLFIHDLGGSVRAVTTVNGLDTGEIIADDVERIKVRALAGSDSIAVQQFLGLSVSGVDIDLAAAPSGASPDGDFDSVLVEGSKLNEVVAVSWIGSKIVTSGLPAQVTIARADMKDELVIRGGGGNDILDARGLPAGKISLTFVTLGSDTIFGSAGNDRVLANGLGNSGNEIARLGAGNDFFQGGDGNDLARMGTGNDVFNASLGNDVGFLGAGNDRMDGGAGNDVAHLEDGNDRYIWRTGGGNDTVDGGGGIDTFVYRDEDNAAPNSSFTIQAKAGSVEFSRTGGEVISLDAVERLQVMVGGGIDSNDVGSLAGTGVKLVAIDLAASVGSGNGDGAGDSVSLEGTGRNDLITIGKFAGGLSVTGLPALVTIVHADSGVPGDVLYISGGAGNDTINASGMPALMVTTLSGDSGNDRLLGGALPGELGGGDGNDTLSGGRSFDTLEGEAGNDRLFGGAGRDGLEGGLDNDRLDGGTGNDSLDGGSGNDVLIGGRGNDEIACGDGADRVKYTSKLDGHDIILDFDGDPTGGQDKLDLDALFDSLGIAASKRAGLVDINDLGNTVEIFVNADGKAGFELFVATLNTADAITKGQDVIVGT
jgi:Ca2+-binding RTX toxin-like protein